MSPPSPITRHPAPRGTLWTNDSSSTAEAVRRYVRSEAWRSPPDETAIPALNRKSRLWRIDVPGAGRCVLKESFVSPRYGVLRRLELAFKLRFLRRGLRAMRLALAATEAGVPTVTPLAFWTDVRQGPRNCFLYSYLEGVPLASLWENGEEGAPIPETRPAYLAYMRKLGGLVGRLHAAGLTHIDLDPTNVLLLPGPSAGSFIPDGTGGIALLDADAFRRIAAPTAPMRFTLAMRSLCRMRIRTKTRYPVDEQVFRAFVDGLANGDTATATRYQRAIDGWARHGRHPFLHFLATCR
ncbi:MAG: hypothetical protein ACOX5G_13490 [Kiritimatiellia bacterium]|jgi:hypothetical protein